MSALQRLTCPLLLAILIATAIFFSAELHSIKQEFDGEMHDLNNRLSSTNARQNMDHVQIESLKSVVSMALNATDAFIESINSTVKEAQSTISEDVAEVNEVVSTQNSVMVYQFAGMFTILGALIALWHLASHYRNLHEPLVQRKIMAVLWMTPIYGVSSWLSLVFANAEPYLTIIRDFYEAYCVYTFLSFLIAVLGRGDRNAVVDLLTRHADHLKPPVNFGGCFRSNELYRENPRAKAEAVLDQCQLFAMQFVLLRPLTSIGWVVSNQLNDPDGFFDYRSPQLYIIITTNASVFFAFSGLVKFYHAVREDLTWCNPFPKFLCIKGVVFMTFWQHMAISVLASTVYSGEFDSQDEVIEFSAQAQNFLICLEMMFFAIAHCFVFPTEEWQEGYRAAQERRQNMKFGDNIALRDFFSDVKTVMKSRKSRRQRHRKRKKSHKLVPGGDVLPSLSTLESDTESNTSDVHHALAVDDGNFHDGARSRLSSISSVDNEDAFAENGGVTWERIEKFIEEAGEGDDESHSSSPAEIT